MLSFCCFMFSSIPCCVCLCCCRCCCWWCWEAKVPLSRFYIKPKVMETIHWSNVKTNTLFAVVINVILTATLYLFKKDYLNECYCCFDMFNVVGWLRWSKMCWLDLLFRSLHALRSFSLSLMHSLTSSRVWNHAGSLSPLPSSYIL